MDGKIKKMEVSSTIDGLCEHLLPGSSLEELNLVVGTIQDVEEREGID